MYHLIVFVLDDPDLCKDTLEAWEAAGITGITILESSGMGKMRKIGVLDDVPLMPGLIDLIKIRENSHRTLFSVVKTQEQIDAVLKATQEVVGDLDNDNTGFLFVVPVSQAYGMSKKRDED
jgi:nitrogen regulatory protein PII